MVVVQKLCPNVFSMVLSSGCFNRFVPNSNHIVVQRVKKSLLHFKGFLRPWRGPRRVCGGFIEYHFHRRLDHTRWRQRSYMLNPVYANAIRMLDTDVIAADTRLRHQAMPAYVAGGGLAKEIGQKTTPWGVSCANGFGPRPHSFIFFHLHNKKAAALLLYLYIII